MSITATLPRQTHLRQRRQGLWKATFSPLIPLPLRQRQLKNFYVQLLWMTSELYDVSDWITKSCASWNLSNDRHARESGAAIPKYPILFFKPITALASPSDDIPVCKLAQFSPEIDYECELVIIIGKQGRDIPEERAFEHVFGYAVGNDVSHRGWQLRRGGGQWGIGKMFDGWAPLSGAIVSPDVRLLSSLNAEFSDHQRSK